MVTFLELNKNIKKEFNIETISQLNRDNSILIHTVLNDNHKYDNVIIDILFKQVFTDLIQADYYDLKRTGQIFKTSEVFSKYESYIINQNVAKKNSKNIKSI